MQRRAIGYTIDRGKKGRCLSTLIACVEGLCQDPWVSGVRQAVQEWLRAWHAAPQMHKLVAKAWRGMWRH
eukprot:726540-Karenia_brevis.AAC.1